MNRWARKRGDVLAEWHLLTEPHRNARGVVVAGCGLSLGDDEAHLELDPDEATVGHRCAACQGIALRSG